MTMDFERVKADGGIFNSLNDYSDNVCKININCIYFIWSLKNYLYILFVTTLI